MRTETAGKPFLRAAAGYRRTDHEPNEAIKDLNTMLIKPTKENC
jgi:hypothetical protein